MPKPFFLPSLSSIRASGLFITALFFSATPEPANSIDFESAELVAAKD